MAFQKTIFGVSLLLTATLSAHASTLSYGDYTYSNITCTSLIAADCANVTVSVSGFLAPVFYPTGEGIITIFDNGGSTPGDTLVLSWDVTYTGSPQPGYPQRGFREQVAPDGIFLAGLSTVTENPVGEPPLQATGQYFNVGTGSSLQDVITISIVPDGLVGQGGLIYVSDSAFVNAPEPSSCAVLVVGLLMISHQVRCTRRVKAWRQLNTIHWWPE